MTMAGEYLDDTVERVPMVDHEGKSGALLERLTLSDGRRLIVKRFSPETDLLMAALGDSVGREYLVWSRGILDLLPQEVGHAVVDGWVDGDETVIVMRDLGDSVLSWQDRLTSDQCRSMLASVAAQHRAFLGAAPQDLTPLADLLTLFAPDRMAPFVRLDEPVGSNRDSWMGDLRRDRSGRCRRAGFRVARRAAASGRRAPVQTDDSGPR